MSDTGLSDAVVESIVACAKESGVQRLVLFGSRARGDYEEKSDIDVVAYRGNLSRFRLDLEECVPTLLTFDVIDSEHIGSKKLSEIIEKEGIVLYDKI